MGEERDRRRLLGIDVVALDLFLGAYCCLASLITNDDVMRTAWISIGIVSIESAFVHEASSLPLRIEESLGYGSACGYSVLSALQCASLGFFGATSPSTNKLTLLLSTANLMSHAFAIIRRRLRNEQAQGDDAEPPEPNRPYQH